VSVEKKKKRNSIMDHGLGPSTLGSKEVQKRDQGVASEMRKIWRMWRLGSQVKEAGSVSS
jgi:hypothetical protein